MSKVIVDTSVWIQFFNAPHSKEKAELDKLLSDNRVVVVGVVVSELFQGSNSQKNCERIEDKIVVLPYAEVSDNVWKKVGETSFNLRKQGITLPLTDLLIATLAREHNFQVYTLDPHFEKIPGVKLYQ